MAQAAIDDITIPREVLAYCADNGLVADLNTSIALARETFAPARQTSVELENDPETGENYVVVQVTAALSIDEALRRNRNYTARWAQTASANGREYIRFLFNIP